MVEDNPVNQMVAEGILTKLGYLVDMAGNGRDAVEALETTPYSAVLMDCHMPVMDGFDATTEIRRREGVSGRTPIIAMTAGVMDEERDRCLAVGMDDFVFKPVDVALLDALLTRWVDGGRFKGGSTGSPSVEGDPPTIDDQGDPLDRERLDALRQLGPADGRGLLPAVVGAFLDEIPARMGALRAAVGAGGGHPLAEAAHQLRGSASNIGATAVAISCQQLEAAGRSDAMPSAQLLDQLEAELGRAGRALADTLPVTA